MAVGREVDFANISELWLDSTNPRLGRRRTDARLSQAQLLKAMAEWNLEELATSFLESGFWTQEAVIAVEERYGNRLRLVVVEGNRRIAALKSLAAATAGDPPSPFWERLVKEGDIDGDLFRHVPYYLADSRDDVDAYLGFRHVTGIKQWDPAEKAEYIAKLVDNKGMTFDEVRRAIGSRAPTVRRHYMAYRLLLQFDDLEVATPIEKIEDRFSVLYLALREASVRRFLGISEIAGETGLRHPVPKRKLAVLEEFALWMFGTDRQLPLFSDSRKVSDFARALASKEALSYLRSARNPTLDQALRHAGAELDDVLSRIQNATEEVESALARIHLYATDTDVVSAIERFAASATELLKKFDYDVRR